MLDGDLLLRCLSAVFNGHTKLMKERESTPRPKSREAPVKDRSERAEARREQIQCTTTRNHAANGLRGAAEELRKQVPQDAYLTQSYTHIYSETLSHS